MNPIVHFEIHANDADKIQKFYETIFGWRVKAMGEQFGGYRMVVTGKNSGEGPATEGINGGITPRVGALPSGGEPVNAFVCIVSVDSVDQYIDKAKAAGATIALEKVKVPSVGDLVYMKDPEGNLFGMLQPAM